MESKQRRTFEELAGPLYAAARRYESYGFEVDELVNEVWLKGRVQTVSEPFIHQRIHWDIQEYIRDQQGSRNQHTRFYKYRQLVNRPLSLNQKVGGDGKQMRLGDCIGDNCLELATVETKDWINWLVRGLSRQTQLYMKLKYVQGWTDVEISVVSGLGATRLSQIHMRTLKILKARMTSECRTG